MHIRTDPEPDTSGPVPPGLFRYKPTTPFFLESTLLTDTRLRPVMTHPVNEPDYIPFFALLLTVIPRYSLGSICS